MIVAAVRCPRRPPKRVPDFLADALTRTSPHHTTHSKPRQIAAARQREMRLQFWNAVVKTINMCGRWEGMGAFEWGRGRARCCAAM